MHQQLILQLRLNDDSSLENFCWQNNTLLEQTLLKSLTETHKDLFQNFYYLWAPTGYGKTHLLQASCHLMSLKQKQAVYLPLSYLKPHGIDVLEDLETLDLVCLDELEHIAGDLMWEEALFNLYQRMQAHPQVVWIVASRNPPKTLKLQLADLASRFSSALTFQIHALNEEAQIHVLQQNAERRGFKLSLPVARFLIHRSSRNTGILLQHLEMLDHAMLVEKRLLTIPFAKKVLAL